MNYSGSLLTVGQEHASLLENYSTMIEETIDLDELARHSYVLLPTFDSSLQETKESLIDVRDRLDAEHRRVGSELGIDIEKKLHLENHHVYHYSFRITKAVSDLGGVK